MRLPAAIRRAVQRRARNCCEYCRCQERFSPSTFSVEHIDPRVAGGGDDLANLAFSCQECNNRKFTATTARDPLSGAIVALFHPRQHHWTDHFAWNDEFTLLLGLSPTGRATINKLQLNRTNIINLRRILYQAGEHPRSTDEETTT